MLDSDGFSTPQAKSHIGFFLFLTSHIRILKNCPVHLVKQKNIKTKILISLSVN